METDPVRVMEMMLGIPGVRVTELDIQPTSLRVELIRRRPLQRAQSAGTRRSRQASSSLTWACIRPWASPCISNGTSVSGAVR